MERDSNIHNFDSGWALEEIVRDEISTLLPKRYHVTAGVVTDRDGSSAGDCDVIIFNDFWFPSLKVGPTIESRRRYLPIEGVYAVLEVKQSLGFKTLDDAMRKLVMTHRLKRPLVEGGRILENSTLGGCYHSVRNPLYSGIVAAGLEKGVTLEDLAWRFIAINQQFDRFRVIRSLCVLGHGMLTWGVHREDGISPALFMRSDLYEPLIPVLMKVEDDGCPFYDLSVGLMTHLDHSVLAPDDLGMHYGFQQRYKAPESEDALLEVDPGWIEFDKRCEPDCGHEPGTISVHYT
ncbi:hypothetical protein E1200_17855 [Actinomadura sp. GC306]|uniref:DUF6602 domain-containing protein n=1 Tax=Actinomadura sp. GC306 TaxID=2530367 RepID=UPI001050B064|nr:DUF6602 domain-containing protein [Actinomadura sp. GC306]TDC65795.1 hypothetical protein E1200_17855 [Actinomadura sp. GC306]